MNGISGGLILIAVGILIYEVMAKDEENAVYGNVAAWSCAAGPVIIGIGCIVWHFL